MAYSLQTPVFLLMRQQPFPQVSDMQAIREHINLLLMTKWHECRYDSRLGCAIWEQDYATISNPTTWKAEAEQAIASLINQYEKRLQYIHVSVDVDEPEETDNEGRIIRIRKRLTIRVNGTLISTGESISSQEFILYFSPVASL